MLVFDRRRLKKAREAAGLTQYEMAAALGYNRNTYCDMERGKVKAVPDINVILAMAEFTGMPVSFFFSEVEGKDEYTKALKMREAKYKKRLDIIEADSETEAERIAKEKGVWDGK